MTAAHSVQTPLAEKDENQLDVMRLVRVVRTHALPAIGIIIVFTILATSVAVTSPKRYSAAATVRINPAKQTVLQPDADASMSNDPTASLIETEVGELQSYALARSVVTQLHLDHSPEFNGSLSPPSALAHLLHRPAPPPSFAIKPVADTLLGHVKVSHVGASYLLTVAAKSRDPQLAAQIANAFVQQFIQTQQGARVNAVEAGGSRISERLGELRIQLEDADTKLQQYKIANGLMSAQGATLTEEEISGLNQRLAEAHAQEAEANAKLSTAKSQLAQGSSGGDVGEALGSPVIQGLRARHAELSQTLAGLQGRYSDAHPKVVKAKRELADTDAQIQAEIGRIISNLDAQAKVARQRSASIEHSVGQSKGSLVQNNRAEVQLNELQRNADAAKSLYDTFLNRFKEADAEAGFQKSDAQIIDLASVPTAASEPKRALIVLFGILGGLSVAVGYMLIAEQLSMGLNDVDAVETGLRRAYLGSIPLLKSTLEPGQTNQKTPFDYVAAKPVSSFAEAFRSLIAAVRFSDQARPPQVIAVTSSLPNEGKTTTSICMARVAAVSGQRTVLVDCDLRKRSVNRLFGSEPTVGLVEVLKGEVSLDQALKMDETTGLTVLPLARADATLAKDMFTTSAMDDLMIQLRERFELVVMDTGPVILVTNTRQLCRHADAVVMLVRWRKTSLRLVRTSLRLLDAAGAPVTGIALGQINLKSKSRIDPADPSSYYRTYRRYYLAD